MGFKADGTQSFGFYRPSVLEFAADVTMAECKAGTKASPWEVSIPVPSGMVFRKTKNQLLLDVDGNLVMRFRRAYGYVGEIAYLQDDPQIPVTVRSSARIQAVFKVWWRYGCLNEERHDSWCFVRLPAYTSTAAFDDESIILTVGDPISGVIEASSSDHGAAQLSGWQPISDAEWKLRSPRTFIEGGFELNGDSIAALPALAVGNFAHFHVPHVPFARMYGFWEPKYLDPYVKAPEMAALRSRSAVRERARTSTPKNSPGRRLRGRYYAKIAQKKDDPLAAAAAAQPNPKPARRKAPPNRFVPTQ